MSDLTIKFDNDKAREHFVSWLCGSGEQDYWEWMEYRENEEQGDITATEFDYWTPTYPGQKSKFRPDLVIAKCGRLKD